MTATHITLPLDRRHLEAAIEAFGTTRDALIGLLDACDGDSDIEPNGDELDQSYPEATGPHGVNAKQEPVASEVNRAPDWAAAWERYQPIGREWSAAFERADALPLGSDDREAAEQVAQQYSAYARIEREAFLSIPAPTLEALVIKMEVSDPIDEEDHERCLVDLRRLAGRA